MLGGRLLPVRAFRAGRHTVASDSSTVSTKGWTQTAAVAVLTGEVRAEGVGKTIDETTLLLPTDVSADPGECIVLRGPNGSGKTTLLRIIGGLLVPSTGTATIGG
ncbi:MAG: ATP-binding cassette domain-containing protein, partial [Terrabacter sp.]|nr:ATP-binding cassette domain-containing protein [Terrabacter sp.]